MLELQFCGSSCKEFNVFGIGARPTPFDELHTQVIELFGNAELVFNSCRHTFNLHAITQCCVECFNKFERVFCVHDVLLWGRLVRNLGNEKAALKAAETRTSVTGVR